MGGVRAGAQRVARSPASFVWGVQRASRALAGWTSLPYGTAYCSPAGVAVNTLPHTLQPEPLTRTPHALMQATPLLPCPAGASAGRSTSRRATARVRTGSERGCGGRHALASGRTGAGLPCASTCSPEPRPCRACTVPNGTLQCCLQKRISGSGGPSSYRGIQRRLRTGLKQEGPNQP